VTSTQEVPDIRRHEHAATLEQWHGALAKAIRDQAIGAVPGILVRMARDGWGHEAEEARRRMLAATSAAREVLEALG
jgi:hypothetical protein